MSEDIFSAGGKLARHLSGFELREGQQQLARAISKAISKEKHLVAEAGTGIGKTFAYLLPALAAGKTLLVSTATKHLQSQIYIKDLPQVEKILGRRINAHLLKGRSNYLCHYRFYEYEAAHTEGAFKSVLAEIRSWLETTRQGDLAEVLPERPEYMPLRRGITSTSDNCFASYCPHFEDCFFKKSRDEAKHAEVLIVNHSLLLAYMSLSETGLGSNLPKMDVAVVDEAHHLSQIAIEAFADQVTSTQLFDLVKDLKNESIVQAGVVGNLDALTEDFRAAISRFNMALLAISDSGEIYLEALKTHAAAYQAFQQLMQAFHGLLQQLAVVEGNSELAQLRDRTRQFAQVIRQIFAPQKAQAMAEAASSEGDDEVADKSINKTTNKTVEQPSHPENSANSTIDDAHNDEVAKSYQQAPTVALLGWGEQGFYATRLPIYLDGRFYQRLTAYAKSWIFVSATMAIGDDFRYFITSLGLPSSIETCMVPSPFDYPNHAVLYVPETDNDPNDPAFIPKLLKKALPALRANKGRAFLLFSSYKNLEKARQFLKRYKGFKLFVQGDQPKIQLIDAFKKTERALLLGTMSFWEGVDIPGRQLSFVLIDKIPFPSPDDPFIREQVRYLKAQGRDAFFQCSLSPAAMRLKQGVGRLIRRQDDKGVLFLGDGRLLQKSYGQVLLSALPRATRVDAHDLITFIETQLHDE